MNQVVMIGNRNPSAFVERSGSPELLPIFRSRQQAELLADILDDPEREQSLADLTNRLGR